MRSTRECDALACRESGSYKSPKPAIPGSSPGCPASSTPALDAEVPAQSLSRPAARVTIPLALYQTKGRNRPERALLTIAIRSHAASFHDPVRVRKAPELLAPSLRDRRTQLARLASRSLDHARFHRPPCEASCGLWWLRPRRAPAARPRPRCRVVRRQLKPGAQAQTPSRAARMPTDCGRAAEKAGAPSRRS